MAYPKMFKCNTVDDMLAMSRLPLSVYPTLLSAVRNIELPIDAEDYSWLTGNEVQVFQVAESNTRKFSRSNLTAPTFTPDDPIIVTGVCVFCYTEPYSTVVEGNSFGPASAITETPASPINLRGGAFINQLFQGGALPAGVDLTSISAAQLDHGGATWRFMWALMHAMRLEFKCPNSSLETIMNERLIDIGNACSRVEFNGLSDAKTPHTFITRRYNARAASDPTMPAAGTEAYDNPDAVAHLPYFVPVNCEQTADGEIVPNRMVATDAAYGQPNALPAVETWYRLPFPMPLDTNTKIQMYMEPGAGDEDYRTRMIDEAIIRAAEGPIPGVAGTFPLSENGDDNIGLANFTQIPTGMVRVGLGFKGFQVREGVCSQWKRVLSNKALMQELLNGTYSPMQGTFANCSALAGPTDQADKIIDEYMSAVGEAGPVGDRG
ncbi:MAG: hypothetical protein WC565_04095 [Parcubacteria group bacterium]